MINLMMKGLSLALFIFLQGISFAQASTMPPKEEGGPFTLANSQVISLVSDGLGRTYDLYIKLPRGYFDPKNQNTRYPVFYLNDGTHTFKVAAGVTHFSSMDKAILVGISFAKGDAGQFSRVRDLTPALDKSWTRYETGGAPQYLDFIEKEVFNLIETKYRVDPSKRVLVGHSLGGSFAAWVLLTQPELFAGYLMTSPSLWFKQDLIFDIEDQYAKQHDALKAKVFVATGALETVEQGMRHEMVLGHQRFVSQLKQRNYLGLALESEIVAGVDHYSVFPIGFTKGLRWISQDW